MSELIGMFFAAFFIFIIKVVVYLPYEASREWKYCCEIIFVVLLFYFYYAICFSNYFFSLKLTVKEVLNVRQWWDSEELFWYILPACLAGFFAFSICKLGAYPTKYFSNKTFVEKATIDYFHCQSWGRRKTAKTLVAWVDDVNLKNHEVNFLGNMCEKRPELKDILPGDHIVFKVKEGVFGRFYEEFDVSKVKKNYSHQFKLKEPIEVGLNINLEISNITEFSNQWLKQDDLKKSNIKWSTGK